MSNRFAGVAYWSVDGKQLAVRGNLEVMPSRYERTGIAGQDAVHGYSELPVVPYVAGDVSTLEGTTRRGYRRGHRRDHHRRGGQRHRVRIAPRLARRTIDRQHARRAIPCPL